MTVFIPTNWYWYVGGDQTQVWSSASKSFVPNSDPNFVSWSSLNTPLNVDVVESIYPLLKSFNVPPYAEVNLRQLRQAIIALGRKAALDNLIANDASGNLAAWWNNSPSLHRYHPIVLQLQTNFNLSNNQLDVLFTTAYNL